MLFSKTKKLFKLVSHFFKVFTCVILNTINFQVLNNISKIECGIFLNNLIKLFSRAVVKCSEFRSFTLNSFSLNFFYINIMLSGINIDDLPAFQTISLFNKCLIILSFPKELFKLAKSFIESEFFFFCVIKAMSSSTISIFSFIVLIFRRT